MDQPADQVEKIIGLSANFPALVLRRHRPRFLGFWNCIPEVNGPSAFAYVIAVP